jgi:hypothetical protein
VVSTRSLVLFACLLPPTAVSLLPPLYPHPYLRTGIALSVASPANCCAYRLSLLPGHETVNTLPHRSLRVSVNSHRVLHETCDRSRGTGERCFVARQSLSFGEYTHSMDNYKRSAWDHRKSFSRSPLVNSSSLCDNVQFG